WQYSRIFASPGARPAFTALLALRVEMRQVLTHAAEPSVRAARFEWWRGEVERGFRGEAQHPLARALAAHLGAAGGAAEYCQELIDAAETEGEDGLSLSDQDFLLYLHRSGGVLAEQLALIEGVRDRHALDAARCIGRVKRFGDLLFSTGAMLRAGRWLFPAAWLEKHALTPASALTAGGAGAMTALLGEMLDALDAERIKARTLMQDRSLPPALRLQWSLAQCDYRLLRG